MKFEELKPGAAGGVCPICDRALKPHARLTLCSVCRGNIGGWDRRPIKHRMAYRDALKVRMTRMAYVVEVDELTQRRERKQQQRRRA